MSLEQKRKLNIKIGNIKGQLTRFSNYLDNFDSNPDYKVLSARLEKTESNLLNDFEDHHLQLELASSDTDDVDFNAERDKFETKFYESVARAKYLLAQDPSLINISNQQNLQSLPSANFQNIRLPPINLPEFDGSFDKFLQFYDTFKTIIHNNRTLSPTQKFSYLLSSLKGEALETIQSIQISDQNYSIAWNLLCERFQNDRVIINSHIKAIFELNTLYRESKDGLRLILDTLQKNLRCLEALGQPTNEWDSILIYLINSKLDNSTRREWEASIKGSQLPTFKEFIEFLNKKCYTLEALDYNAKPTNSKTPNRVHSHVSPMVPKCFFCKGTHWLNMCEKFLSLSVNSRLTETKKMHLCTNCLRSSHTTKDCQSNGCRKCQYKHHTLLHFERRGTEASAETSTAAPVSSNVCIETIVVDQESENKNSDSIVTTFSNETQFSQVLLSTAKVYIYDKNNKIILCRVLLDSGSQANYITYELAESLNLNLSKIDLPVSGISQNLIKIKHSTTTSIQSIHNLFNVKLNFLVIEKITENLPGFSFKQNIINIPSNIKLADDEFEKSKPINLLLGAGIFYSLLCVGQIKLGNDLPLLQKTHLGWIISGPLHLNQRQNKTICNLNINKSNIETQLEKFWKLEECSSSNINNKFSREELECEEHFTKTTIRDSTGRFVVSLPTKDNLVELGDSKEIARNRFYAVEKRLDKNLELKKSYSSFMDEYISLGHMSPVNETENHLSKLNYYLPHHCVVKLTSSTTKIRVVFDASAKSSTGVSLNDALKIGPTIQDDLISILIRFRTHNYVVTGDIEKMYRMVNISESDKDLQRIFWRSNVQDELKSYKLNTVTYGTSSAPFLAIRSLHQVAYDNLTKYPEACNIILRDFYVDDLIFGTSSVNDAIRLKTEISEMLAGSGFLLRKWTSNNKTILQLNENSQDLPQYFITDDKNVRTLGIFWEPNQDNLSYSVNISAEGKIAKFTKRFILSVVSQIFDPLGLLGPIIVRAKLILQELWKLHLDWDETVPHNLHSLFGQFYKQLNKINNIHIPRHVLLKNSVSVELHAFCDASLVAYGACIYLVSRDQYNNRFSQLMCAKSRVAPIKGVSLPRLELCGALLLVQLVKKVSSSLNLDILKVHFWTDSTIVLSWLRIEPNNLKMFVANRISEILSLSAIENWNHVKSKENPADIISRGMNPEDLAKSDMWWSGPTWLVLEPPEWPRQLGLTENELPELKKNNILTFLSINDFSILERYSSLSKLKRAISYWLRFIHNARSPKIDRIIGPLSLDELDTSLLRLIYIAQVQDFLTEINDLKTKGSVSSKSRLLTLDPFLYKDLIRVGGRLHNSDIPYNQKHPFVLCSKSKLTNLIIHFEHQRLMHAGTQAVLASVREQFWILNGRNAVKNVVRKCITCFKNNPKLTCPKMGNLPSPRVTISRPFSVCGIDLAGPFLVKDGMTRSRKMVKCYLCVFVCFATKAAHLELVSDMSVEAFINALKRFVSRRGIPTKIYSDNGGNFKGAANEFESIYKYFIDNDSSGVGDFLVKQQIEWLFIPPRSPHFGGLWEACVKSAKLHLKRILGNAHLTFEQLYTIIVQVEAVLNSRPITPLSDNPNDFEPLTPSHFLVGQRLTSLPQKSLLEVPTNRVTNYQRLQQITQHFWLRWQREYLCSLQQRFKWKRSSNNSDKLKVGMMVLLKEDGSAPLHWQIGRIVEVHPGIDEEVRVVTVKTLKGIFKRSFAKVCPLPIDL